MPLAGLTGLGLMNQMHASDHVSPETRKLSHAESRAIFERRTRRGAVLLLIVATVLTVLAVGASVRFTGFAALVIVFAGSVWFTYRVLVARWAKFRNLPITKLNRM